MSRLAAMQRLRAEGVSDFLIGERFNLSRQRVHTLLGPRPRPAKPELPAKPTYPEPFGSFLRAWRTRRGMTQAQVGELLGVSFFTVSCWERGRPCMHEQAMRAVLAERSEVSLVTRGKTS